MNYNEAIQKWVQYDNKLKEYNEQIKPIRDYKKKLEEKIIEYSKNNKLEEHIIQISDGNITFKQQTNQTPLSMKFIEKCLHEIIPSKISVDKIIEYITSLRQITQKTNIKRSIVTEK